MKLDIQPTDALIIVDPQNDFLPGGALAVAGGDEIIYPIVKLSREFNRAGATIVITQDWHPADHESFADWHTSSAMPLPSAPFTQINTDYGPQTLWPDHCIQGSVGADFSKLLGDALLHADLIIRKGTNPKIDSYSAFKENDKKTLTGLGGYLHDKGVYRIFVVGLAYDFCVGYSAIDGANLGFESFVIKSLTRSIAMPIPLHDCPYPSTTVDLIESEFDVAGVKVIEEVE